MTTETVVDVVRDFDAMAAECGGLEAATIHAMTLRANAAHAREVEAKDALIRRAGRRISKLASSLNQANVDRLREVEALRHDLAAYMQIANAEAGARIEAEDRTEAAEADAKDAELWRKHKGSFAVLSAMLDAARPLVLNSLKANEAADAAIASGGEG